MWRGGTVLAVPHGVSEWNGTVGHRIGEISSMMMDVPTTMMMKDSMVALSWEGSLSPRSSGVVVDFTGCGSFLLQHRLEFEGWRNMVPITGLLYIRRQKGNTNNNDDDDLLLRVGVLPVNIALGCMSESLMMMELGSIHDGIVHYLSEDTHITYLPHAHHPYTLLIERSDGQRTIRITSQPR